MKRSSLGVRVLVLGFVIAVCISCSASGPRDADSLVTKLDVEIPDVVERDNSPSIQAAVVRENQIVWSRAFGENSSIEHVHMNASVQKTFAATAILQLVERGQVELDAEAGTYLPFAVRHPV